MSGIIGKNSTRGSGAIGTVAIGADAVTGANIADNAIDSEHYVDGSIDNAHIADDAINSEHYADGSIDNAHIADDAIDSEHYVDGSIDNAHIADDAIDSEHYADGSIDNAHIADDAINSEHYADGSIDNAHIADDAIDSEHYAAGSIDTAHIATNQIDETLMKDAFVGDFTDATVTASDYFLHGDATDSGNTKKDTVQGILDLAGGGGLPSVGAYAYTNTGQVIATGTWTKREFEVEWYDFGADYDNSTNYRFTADTEGKYLITLADGFGQGLAANKIGNHAIYVGGAVHTRQSFSPGVALIENSIHTTWHDNTGSQYYEAFLEHNNGSNRTADVGVGLVHIVVQLMIDDS